jgi:DNA-binding response OmpR family regulator
MGTRTRIAVATRSRAERATLGAWLDSADFQAVPVANIGASAREIQALKFEMLIVDAELMTLGSLMHVARYRATPLPVIVIGDADPDAEVDAWRRGASYLVRPIERAGLLFAVSLALAEGRPLRRSPRKLVPRLHGLIDGVPSHVLDVSQEGVRLEVAERHRTSLPPAFTLRVPVFNVAVLVQRVWVSTGVGPSSQLWCGGALTRNPQRSAQSWQMLVDMTPGSAS